MEFAEFFESLGNTKDMYKELKRQQKIFREQLSSELVEFIFLWYPEYSPKRTPLENTLNKIAQKYSNEVWECLDLVEYRSTRSLPGKKKSKIPKLKSKKEAENELLEFLRLIPTENIEHAKQVYWESYDEEQKQDMFLLKIHEIMKKVLVEMFFDDVLNLDSDYLRLLDDYIHTTAFTFADNCYELLED